MKPLAVLYQKACYCPIMKPLAVLYQKVCYCPKMKPLAALHYLLIKKLVIAFKVKLLIHVSLMCFQAKGAFVHLPLHFFFDESIFAMVRRAKIGAEILTRLAAGISSKNRKKINTVWRY